MDSDSAQPQDDNSSEANRSPEESVDFNPANLFEEAADSSGIAPESSSPGQKWEPPLPSDLAQWFPEMEILGIIGRGGMGAVYKGVQKTLGRVVAIKLLPEEFSQVPEFAERFRREATALGALKHPNIVAIHNTGLTSAGHHYFVMEFVDGSDFHQHIRSGRLNVDRALAAMDQICKGLKFAHGEGFVHRDIKPGNIFITRDGVIKVGDFGLAKIGQTEDQTTKQQQNGDLSLTMTGMAMGTLFYSAPEQLQGGTVDHRADIYSLGVMLYEMLTGKLPQGAFKLPSEKIKVDSRIDDIVMRAIQEDPGHRYQTVSEFQNDLNLIRKGPDSGPISNPVLPKASHPVSPFPLWQIMGLSLGFAILLVATGIFVWWVFFDGRDRADPLPSGLSPRQVDANPIPPPAPQIAGETNKVSPTVQKPTIGARPSPDPIAQRPVATRERLKPIEKNKPITSSDRNEDDSVLTLLDLQYLSALNREHDQARAANQTGLTALLTGEIERVKSGEKIPSTDPPATHERLVALRNIFRGELAKGIPLCNGIDFTNWNGVDENTWKITGGALWGSQGTPISQIVPFRQFEMVGEIYVSQSGNGGIFLLGPDTPGEPYWYEKTMEFAIVGSGAVDSGGVWTGGFTEPNLGLPNFETPETNLILDSEWTPFRIRITSEGLQSWINGQPAATMPLYNPNKGLSYIGLEAKSKLVGYRKLRVKEIDL